MKKLISLIKTCMTENMSLFKLKNKNNTKVSRKVFPIFITFACFFSIWSYANIIMEPLVKIHLEFVLLTLFVFLTAILTLVEGIYKSSSLLFNCKDDNLLLSLPIKKSTVLFVRVFKFYVFEVLYNSLFLIPAIVVYLRYVNVGVSYYIVSLLALILLPIIPIVISCIIGGIISVSSSKFRFKNLVQILITTLFLLLIMYASFNLERIIMNIAEKATGINDFITRIYYPAGAYIKLITDFKISDLLLFIIIHIAIFVFAIMLLSTVYFKINSRTKAVKTSLRKGKYRIKKNKPMIALIKKEFKKFVDSPVFIINAGFGLVLFVVACIAITIKFDKFVNTLINQGILITMEQVKMYFPVILFGLICFTSLLTSITSSMISLEGKSFNILKSLPIKPEKIILSKILTAVLIMIPFMLIGDIVFFIKFKLSILEMILIIISTIIMPLVSETIGILINLKYPKMDAENDTEVVKQSMSSGIAVFIGFVLMALTGYVLYKLIESGISIDLTIVIGLAFYTLIYIGLLIYLKKKSVKEFNSINI